MTSLFGLITLVAYLFLPILFLCQLWNDRSENLFKWLLRAAICGVYIANLFFIGVWSMTTVAFMRYPLLLSFFVVLFKSSRNLKRRAYVGTTSVKAATGYAINIALCLFFSWEVLYCSWGRICPKNAISLEFPLKEKARFSVIHGGTNLLINHHSPNKAQKFALDIVQVNHLGFRAKSNPKTVEDFAVFASVVSSPSNGVVVESIDAFEDLRPSEMDPDHPAGNHLAIQIDGADDLVVLLAHLKKGSLLVQKGDVVKKGQPVAQVGNTGNTSEPHLHIHCVKGSDGEFLFSGEGIPMKFNGRFLVRNDRISNIASTSQEQLDRTHQDF